ncbi:hypothetical protein AMATHDRAFT_46847 [Amanita thiersii Skay4041]|uniref:Uncharacterized protein n=1 Tax=Amanita thiersii Skay4041 TaxID=703135 RepID=A0A2A9NVD4_9AGAR|nr:hypothetical protein AMATHDRAFT_46847 [Amanita thiersii Skay4041]
MNLEYNATAFTATGLKNATHQLIISTSHLDYQAFINFDYAIYTFDQPDGISTVSSPSFSTQSEKPQIAASTDNESSHSKINVGAVVGIILGIFGLFVITISAVAYRRYQKRRRRRARRKILPISVTHKLEGTSASPSSNKRGKSRSPRLDILGNPIMTKGSSFASAPSMPSPSVEIQEQTSAQLDKELTPQRSLQHSPRLATQGSGAETESTVVGVEQRD